MSSLRKRDSEGCPILWILREGNTKGSVNGSVYITSVRCGMPGNPSASQMLYEVQVNMTNGDVTQTRVLTDNKVTTFNIR